MSFYSILFATPEDRLGIESPERPDFFIDLNCDQIVAAVIAGKEEYNLIPFFHVCLHRVDAIEYRQEIMRDLEGTRLCEHVKAFAQAMRATRERLMRAQRLHSREEQQAWFLDAADTYCKAVKTLAASIANLNLNSRGFRRFRDFLKRYVSSMQFQSLAFRASDLKRGLAAIEYCIQIRGNSFTVRKYNHETDYSLEVEAAFEKFKQGAVRNYLAKFAPRDEMNHVEAKIAEFVAQLHPGIFGALGEFCARYGDFMDQTLAAFDREVQFYIAYLEYIASLKNAGLRLCYPELSSDPGGVYDYDGFDIALAHKLCGEHGSVVCNDFHLQGPERVLVISGPNQGGKTTFDRTFGQLNYLASIGCQVPGTTARLAHFDRLFTHFEREERVENLRGKLEDDLTRIQGLLAGATQRSIIILNEIFTSTTIRDEEFLSREIMQRIMQVGALCVWVTFVDELASLAPQIVSIVSTVQQDNPAIRTFKIVRQPADGLAYALAIAQKHRLSYDAIKQRLGT